jgi:hypothetical protein
MWDLDFTEGSHLLYPLAVRSASGAKKCRKYRFRNPKGAASQSGNLEFPRKSGHRVKGYPGCSKVAGETYPRDECRRRLL